MSPESSESHQPFQAPIAKSEKKIREEKRELLGFCINGAENLLDVFFWPSFFRTTEYTNTSPQKFIFVQNLCDKVFFGGGHLFLILGILSFCRAALISQC